MRKRHVMFTAMLFWAGMSTICRAGANAPASVYFWGVGDPASVSCQQFLFFAGEGQLYADDLRFLPATLPMVLPECESAVAVLRLSPTVLAAVLENGLSRQAAINAILTRRSELTARYGQPIAVQLDADCPSSQLSDYLDFLNSLKPLLENELSLTIIGSWLQRDRAQEIGKLDIPVYVMLYTLVPGRTFDTWRGELPAVAFADVLENLTEACERQLIRPERLTVVLPCYTQVTIFDDSGNRICRSPAKDWIAPMEESGALEAVMPLPAHLKPAVGNMQLWRVKRTGIYGTHILRSGSMIAKETFDKDAWHKAGAIVTDRLKRSIRLGLALGVAKRGTDDTLAFPSDFP